MLELKTTLIQDIKSTYMFAVLTGRPADSAQTAKKLLREPKRPHILSNASLFRNSILFLRCFFFFQVMPGDNLFRYSRSRQMFKCFCFGFLFACAMRSTTSIHHRMMEEIRLFLKSTISYSQDFLLSC